MADSGTYDQATILRRQKIAEQMWADSTKFRPIRHWAEGLDQLGGAALGAFALNKTDKQASAARQSERDAILAALNPGAQPTMQPEPSPAMPSSAPTAPSSVPAPMSAPVSSPDELSYMPRYGTVDPSKIPIPTPRPQGLGDPDYSSNFGNIVSVTDDTGRDITQQVTGRPTKVASTDPTGPGLPAPPMAPATPPSGPSAVAAAMTPQAPSAAPARPAGPVASPSPGPGPIPDANKRAIAALLQATPGSAAQQLGVTLAAQSLQPRNVTYQTLPDGTVIQMDPTGRLPPRPVYKADAKPQFVPNVSPNQYGVPQPGFVDPLKMQAFDINGRPMASNPTSPTVNPDVTGEEFLKTVPKAQADQIKGIAEGRISPPGAFALKTPYWQKMLTDVAQYEPGFDLTKWGARAATAKDFASGKSAQNITAFNTAIGHLETLDKAAKELGNTSFPIYNNVANMLANATGDPRVKKFEIAKTAVADELTRAFRGTGGNVHDLVQWENAINAAGSPQQLQAAVRQAVELLRSRIDSMGETYNRGMNTKTEPIKLLSPKAQDAIMRLSGEGEPERTPSAAPATDKVRRYNPATGKIE